jgi:hypothetical protein
MAQTNAINAGPSWAWSIPVWVGGLGIVSGMLTVAVVAGGIRAQLAAQTEEVKDLVLEIRGMMRTLTDHEVRITTVEKICEWNHEKE